MNIVVWVIDTLRYDHIGAHGNNWIKTPNLDPLAGGLHPVLEPPLSRAGRKVVQRNLAHGTGVSRF